MYRACDLKEIPEQLLDMVSAVRVGKIQLLREPYVKLHHFMQQDEDTPQMGEIR